MKKLEYSLELIIILSAVLIFLFPITQLVGLAALLFLGWLAIFSWIVRSDFTLADAVSLARVFTAFILLALFRSSDHDSWWPVILWFIILAADGLDGWIARRFRSAPHGGMLDMSCDHIIASLLVFSSVSWLGVDSWLLLYCLLRPVFLLYMFYAGSHLNLIGKHRMRAKIICVLSLMAFIHNFSPLSSLLVKNLISLGGLLLLGYSFTADVIIGRKIQNSFSESAVH